MNIKKVYYRSITLTYSALIVFNFPLSSCLCGVMSGCPSHTLSAPLADYSCYAICLFIVCRLHNPGESDRVWCWSFLFLGLLAFLLYQWGINYCRLNPLTCMIKVCEPGERRYSETLTQSLFLNTFILGHLVFISQRGNKNIIIIMCYQKYTVL